MNTDTPSGTATTSNYFTVAQGDDRAAIKQEQEQEDRSRTSETPVTDGQATPADAAGPADAKAAKAEVRRQRIAAAVERSRTEYKPEHAYTERGWFQTDLDRNVLSKHKADRQQLEYLSTALYFASPPDPRGALDAIMAVFDPSAKSLGGLTRELVDVGLRAALDLRDFDAGLKLIECAKSLWKGQFAGYSALSADVYLAAGRPKDALTPLLISLSSFGLHQPVLVRLSQALKAITVPSPLSSHDGYGYASTAKLIQVVDKAVEWRGTFLSKPLFADEGTGEPGSDNNGPGTVRSTVEVEVPGTSSHGPVPTTEITDIAKLKLGTVDGGRASAAHIQSAQSLTPGQNHDLEPVDPSAVSRELGLDEEQTRALAGTWARLNKGFRGEDETVEKSVREL